MNFSPHNILVVSHDAGGAEIISAWVKQQPGCNFHFVLAGPAVAIFRRKLNSLPLTSWENLPECLERVDLVLTGTSWGSDLEKRAIVMARQRSVRVVTYLDHWHNYPRRFELAGEMVLPDEIWVGDRYAFDLARTAFPQRRIRLEPNMYFKEIVSELAEGCQPVSGKQEGVRILYVSEPTSQAARRHCGDPQARGYTEFEAMAGYLNYLRGRPERISQIRVRPHPSEEPGKYRQVIDDYQDLPVEESRDAALLEDCRWADWVVGCDSMAMVIGVLAKKKVFSCIPPNGKPLSLPYPEIVQLFKEPIE